MSAWGKRCKCVSIGLKAKCWAQEIKGLKCLSESTSVMMPSCRETDVIVEGGVPDTRSAVVFQ